MNLQTVEIASLAGLIAAPFFSTIQMGTVDAIIVTGCHRKTIDHINRVGIQFFPGFSQQTEQGQEQIGNAVQTAIEAALFQDLRNVPIFLQVDTCLLNISTKMQCRCDGSGHHFGIAHLALSVFVMMKSFQHIVTKAINCYNLGVHAILRFGFGLVPINFTRFRMDFLVISPLGGYLG